MNEVYVVYLHQNKVNHKRYVGKTGKMPEERWRKNGYGYKKNKAFWSDIQKYGWDAFQHIIVFVVTSEKEAYAKEKELIAYFKSNQPEYGYNLIEGDLGKYGCNLTEETKKLLRRATIENGQAKTVRCVETNTIYHTIEMAARDVGTKSKYISDCCNDRRKTVKNYHWEFVDHTKKNGGVNVTNESKPVICLTTNEVYPSIKAAAKAHEIDYTQIRKCCHGKRPTAGKCQWAFLEIERED